MEALIRLERVEEKRVLKKIVIASDIPSNREQIRNGENGYLVQLDPYQIASTIQMILKDKVKQESIKQSMVGENIDFSVEINKLLEY